MIVELPNESLSVPPSVRTTPLALIVILSSALAPNNVTVPAVNVPVVTSLSTNFMPLASNKPKVVVLSPNTCTPAACILVFSPSATRPSKNLVVVPYSASLKFGDWPIVFITIPVAVNEAWAFWLSIANWAAEAEALAPAAKLLALVDDVFIAFVWAVVALVVASPAAAVPIAFP